MLHFSAWTIVSLYNKVSLLSSYIAYLFFRSSPRLNFQSCCRIQIINTFVWNTGQPTASPKKPFSFIEICTFWPRKEALFCTTKRSCQTSNVDDCVKGGVWNFFPVGCRLVDGVRTSSEQTTSSTNQRQLASAARVHASKQFYNLSPILLNDITWLFKLPLNSPIFS